ncbi:hydroperoxide isomerase ALOXE3-like [Takifugu flavidus]|uniref:Hydroperoxide isomerase ALOXE3 n=1 Tax=Takifugu flavidus TaxID=433684 RepID=A0A5C6NN62_9TELE|nr:hydroperoxide isomerase ALOXE3-like [Takifugu flavidus]TWW68834.1 Hydroperoxide isomerase ALOXE3 [Takifugu flavidus]
MAKYHLEVTTGNQNYSGTFDQLFATLIGSDGRSDKIQLNIFGIGRGSTWTHVFKTKSSLGKLLMLKVTKEARRLKDDEWYCSKIVVKTPEGEEILFPCYRWISNGELVELRGGRAMKAFEDDHPFLCDHRQRELSRKKQLYTWRTLAEGLMEINGFTDVSQIPSELQFSDSKNLEMMSTETIIRTELVLKGLLGSEENWESLEDMQRIFCFRTTPMSEYVADHWREDDFYGYQFLNGVNPNIITKCTVLPTNFPVTEEMVKAFLGGSSLQEELQKGNIFIFDAKKMDGLPGREYEGKPLQVTPGLCLFYVNAEKKLMPIAIQLQQEPSETNPIFLPSDSETDWLLAKFFIKNAYALMHQSISHLLRTHFMAEAYIVAGLRCLPEIHPIYKLLMPHFRYTLHVNTGGRKNLFGSNGALRESSLGFNGIMELMRRDFADLHYSYFFLPENVRARGLDSIPNNLYRDDGLKLWNIISSFVTAMVGYYYPTDCEVTRDTELQEWINEIFVHCLLGKKATGFPEAFTTAEELIKFLTMVIFTVSAQHSAVNNPQYDFCSMMPNYSLLLRKPPPTTKGQSSMETVLETLPNVSESINFATASIVLTGNYTDKIYLGNYPDERFDEATPKQIIKEFQAQLSQLSKEIAERAAERNPPYVYMDPTQMENSIAI